MTGQRPTSRRGRRTLRHRRVAALLAVLVLVAACGGGDDDAEDTGDETTDGTADETTDDGAGDETEDTEGDDAAADGEPVELTMWFNGETVPPDEFAQLEEEHNIIVSYDIRGDDILPLMQQMGEAGEQLPDIIEVDTNTVPAYIEAGSIMPLDDLLATWEEEDPELYADVPQMAWDNGTFDGQVYHHANKAGFDLMYYNIEQMEAVGIDPASIETQMDMVDAGIALKEEFPDLPEYFGTGGTSPDRVFEWANTFDVPWIGAEENIPDLNTPQGHAMIEWLRTLFDEGLVNPEYMIGDQDESQGAFASGELPMLQEGSNGGISFAEAGWNYDEHYVTFAPPLSGTGDEEDPTHTMVPRGLSITADTEHPYEASLVLRYLQEQEQVIPRVTELFSSPILSNALFESDEFTELYPWFTDEILEAMLSAESQLPPGTNTLAIGGVLKAMLDELTVTGTDESAEDLGARYVEEMLALDG